TACAGCANASARPAAASRRGRRATAAGASRRTCPIARPGAPAEPRGISGRRRGFSARGPTHPPPQPTRPGRPPRGGARARFERVAAATPPKKEETMADADSIRSLYAALNAGDLEGFGAMLADDFVEHEETPGLAPTKDGVVEFFRMYRAAFPDLRMEP